MISKNVKDYSISIVLSLIVAIRDIEHWFFVVEASSVLNVNRSRKHVDFYTVLDVSLTRKPSWYLRAMSARIYWATILLTIKAYQRMLEDTFSENQLSKSKWFWRLSSISE